MRKTDLPRAAIEGAFARLGETQNRWRSVSASARSAELLIQRGLQSPPLSIWSDQRGGMALIFGIVATVVVAIVGLGIDVVGWYRTDRAMQNAADSAAIAAATNATGTYQSEAKAVTGQNGSVD